jgi:hypothetical protein
MATRPLQYVSVSMSMSTVLFCRPGTCAAAVPDDRWKVRWYHLGTRFRESPHREGGAGRERCGQGARQPSADVDDARTCNSGLTETSLGVRQGKDSSAASGRGRPSSWPKVQLQSEVLDAARLTRSQEMLAGAGENSSPHPTQAPPPVKQCWWYADLLSEACQPHRHGQDARHQRQRLDHSDWSCSVEER